MSLDQQPKGSRAERRRAARRPDIERLYAEAQEAAAARTAHLDHLSTHAAGTFDALLEMWCTALASGYTEATEAEALEALADCLGGLVPPLTQAVGVLEHHTGEGLPGQIALLVSHLDMLTKITAALREADALPGTPEGRGVANEVVGLAGLIPVQANDLSHGIKITTQGG